MTGLTINRELVLSTCHMTKETADALNAVGVDELLRFYHNLPPRYSTEEQRQQFGGMPFDIIEFGYRLYVGEAEPDYSPKELLPLYELAYRNGCKWLVLDCDGPVHPDLPQYEW